MKNIFEFDRLTKELRRSRGKRVFTGGVFDILHLGHVTFLQKCKALGDVLIVGIQDDKTVKKYKGGGRPINPLLVRQKVVAALECVDFVTKVSEFNLESLERVCDMLKIDTVVHKRRKSFFDKSKYKDKIVVLSPDYSRTPHSTSLIIEKIKKCG